MTPLEMALADLGKFGGNPKRPYDGQDHTAEGKRGQTEVKGLSMRDIADCIRRGQEIAKAPGDRIDYDEVAVIQAALCEIEKMMGIYPNIERK